MKRDESIPHEEEFLSALAACEDALAAGLNPSVEGHLDDTPDLRPSLQRGVHCLQLLRQVLPKRAKETQTPGDLGTGSGQPLDAGMTLGRFKIAHELGRGGFGVVYLADDPKLGRQVALKVPRFNVLAAPDLHERFYREARAAAGLDHPNIVPVYEAGEIGPVCFIISKYCPGPTLAAWLRDHPAAVTPHAAALFVANLAEGVEHAHQNGVWHRDLKPANILLVAGFRTESANQGKFLSSYLAKIADFGLARRVEEAGQTASHAIMGTPCYMAPEQATGVSSRCGPRVDIYALGAILYEMLVGRPPHQGDSELETLRLVQHEEPVPPRRLCGQVPRDLETICLKCLEKDPQNRYAKASDLADDLRRFLEGRPIVARPVSSVERFFRLCHRKPLVAGLSAALVLAGLLGITGFAWHTHRSAHQQEEIGRKSAEVQEAWQRAEENFARASAATAVADSRYQQNWATVDRLADMSWGLLRQPNLSERDRGVIEELIASYQRFVEDKSDDPAVQVRSARALLRVAQLCSKLGQSAKEVDATARALALMKSQIELDPGNDDARHALADCYFQRAFTESRVAGKAGLVQSVKSYELSLSTLEPLLDRAPESLAIRISKAALLDNLGRIFGVLKEPERSEQAFRQALELQQAMYRAAPENASRRNALAGAFEGMSQATQSRNRLTEAEDWCRKAIEVQQKLAREQPLPSYQWHLGWLHGRMAEIASAQGQANNVAFHAQEAVRQFDELVSSFPGNSDYQGLLARFLELSAHQQSGAGNLPGALAAMRRAVAIREQLAAAAPGARLYLRELSYPLRFLGSLLHELEENDEARQVFARALTLHETLPDAFPEEPEFRNLIARRTRDIGDKLQAMGTMTEAEKAYRMAVAYFEVLSSAFPDDPENLRQLAETFQRIARMHTTTRSHNQALAACLEFVSFRELIVRRFGALEKDRQALVRALWQLVSAHEAVGQADAAARVLERCTEECRLLANGSPQDKNHRSELVRSGERLVRLLQKQKKVEPAIAASAALIVDRTMLITLFEAAPAQKTALADTLARHGSLLQSAGRTSESVAAYRAALQAAPESAKMLNNLAWILAMCSDPGLRSPAEARDLAQQAVKAKPRDATYYNTLGAAYYRNREFALAIEALDKSIQLRGRDTGEDLLLKALAHWQIGDLNAARRDYDQAIVWMQQHAPVHETLRRLRAEAEQLLGIREKSGN